MSRAIMILLSVLLGFMTIIPLWADTPAGSWLYAEIASMGSDDDSSGPSLAVAADGTLHMVWYDAWPFTPDNDGIFYSHKPVGGTWASMEKVSTESSGGGMGQSSPHSPFLALGSDGTLYVAWSDPTDYNGAGSDCDIFFKYKPSGGAWSTTEVLSVSSSVESHGPDLAVEPDGTLHVCWTDTDLADIQNVYYIFKTPGSDWSDTETVVTGNMVDFGSSTMAVDSAGDVHLAWSRYLTDPDDYDIFYNRKPRQGTWGAAELVSTESHGMSFSPSLFIDANMTVHVAWNDKTDYDMCGTDYDIFYKKKTLGGAWTAAEVVTDSIDEDSKYPEMVVKNNGNVCVGWSQRYFGSSYPKVNYKYRKTTGDWFPEEIVSTECEKWVRSITIELDGDQNLHAAWSADTTLEGSDDDIFYKMRPEAGGMLWADNFHISAATGGSSEFALDAGYLNGDVYYLVLGSKSGTSPGFPIPGGDKIVPLNWDRITDYILWHTNTSPFTDFYATLNPMGKGSAQLNLRAGLTQLIGVKIHFAYICGNPWKVVSNAIWIEMVP